MFPTFEQKRAIAREASRKGYGPNGKRGAPVYVTVRFNLPGNVKLPLWKHIKAPPGWRKCQQSPRRLHQPWATFCCTDPNAISNMTAEWVEETKTKLLLISERR